MQEVSSIQTCVRTFHHELRAGLVQAGPRPHSLPDLPGAGSGPGEVTTPTPRRWTSWDPECCCLAGSEVRWGGGVLRCAHPCPPRYFKFDPMLSLPIVPEDKMTSVRVLFVAVSGVLPNVPNRTNQTLGRFYFL
jgi:hypothetical protein